MSQKKIDPKDDVSEPSVAHRLAEQNDPVSEPGIRSRKLPEEEPTIDISEAEDEQMER